MNEKVKILFSVIIISVCFFTGYIFYGDKDGTESDNPTDTDSDISSTEQVQITTEGVDDIHTSDEPQASYELKTIGAMYVHYLDVGQGDCTLIVCKDEAMVIDSGMDNQGTKIQYYLMQQGVEKIKYLILTHSDSDHIGSADVVVTKFDIEKVIMNEYDTGTDTYDDFISAMEYKNYKTTPGNVGDIYKLGDATFEIIYPYEISDNTNNNSISIVLTHGENTFLFTGDGDFQAESQMVSSGKLPSIDVYKVGHHGSGYSSSEELLTCISPKYAIISVGKENDYGHPHESVMNRFDSMGIKVFRTDEQGTIVAISDGINLDINTGKTQDETITYVCNTNTKKFHMPVCDSVNDMKEKNKMEVSLTREEVISLGYKPCGRCNP